MQQAKEALCLLWREFTVTVKINSIATPHWQSKWQQMHLHESCFTLNMNTMLPSNVTGPKCRPHGVPWGGSEHPTAANGTGLLCVHSQGRTTAWLVLVCLPSGPEPVSTLPQGTGTLLALSLPSLPQNLRVTSVDWSLMFWFGKDGYQQFLLASVFKVEPMLQQTLDLISVSIVSSARPPCTCMCLLSNRTSSCTASTPTHWTRTTLQTCSGKLLCPRLWSAKKFNRQGANGTVLPLQICSWAVQRPLLADMRPCHPGPTLLSARSLRGAQPDVQFHQEYALNWTPDGIRPLRWDVMRCFTDFLLRRIPMCSDLTLCGRRIEHRHRRSSPPVYVTQHWLEVSTQPIRCQESIETFWKIKGRFIKENKLSF